MSEYAHPAMVVEASWLEAHLDAPNLRIVDCDAPEAHGRAHIPGAVCPSDNFFKDAEDRRFVMGPGQFARAMAELGIGDETEVVVYDGSGMHFTGRTWWCLSYYGHGRVRTLNGGWKQWFREGRPVSIDATTAPPARFTPRPDEALRATAEYVLAAIGRPDIVILDVRSEEEWEGSNTRGNKRSGHMPGAVHVEWVRNMRADDPVRLKPAGELRAMYEAVGVTPDREIITVCQAGVRAAQAAQTLRLLGYERVRDYDGSFAEWGNRDDTPIVR